MSKQSGLGMKFLVDGYDISGDVNAITGMSMPRGSADDTGIDKYAVERLLLKRDGALAVTATWNPGPENDAIHNALKGLPRTDRILMALVGQSLGGQAAALPGKQLDYNFDRNAEGFLALTTQALANGYPLEWGLQATPGIRTDTAGTNGTAIDGAAATNFGLQAYVEVKSVTGTSVTIKLQDSADNVTFADITAGAFSAFTGRGAARLQTARNATIRRYIRVVTSGTFTNAQFAVAVMRNTATVNF